MSYNDNDTTFDIRHTRPRVGKTNRDRMGEAHKRNRENKQTRVAWQRECTGVREVPFPSHSCNGKRNRHRVTIGDTVKEASYGRRLHRRRYAG